MTPENKEGKKYLTFVELLINKRSKFYDIIFHQYFHLREQLIGKYDSAYWDDLMSEYEHILKTDEMEFEIFVYIHECYYYR